MLLRKKAGSALGITGTILISMLIPCATCHELPDSHSHDTAAVTTGTDEQPPRISVPYALQTLPTSSTADAKSLPQIHLPVIKGAGKPWTRTDLKNQPRNFQFAIVSDRAGGVRPGIFDDAVKKLNLLQPEFVMSVGDFIKGYTRKEEQLKMEWDEFEKLVAGLQMPFFYVPGNHDMSNPVQKAEWHRRFGPNYYHFVYGDVLFLCLDTEDEAKGVLSREQVDYFKRVLQEHQDVRWTLLFMHRPIWVKEELRNLSDTNQSDLKLLKRSGWYDIEQMLHGRKYTVYAGHVHSYTKYIRHDNKYFILATTGGGSPLRGEWPYGEFDHVAWITMTDEGPIMANLLLAGIMDENLRTNDITTLLRATTDRSIEPAATITDPLPFTSSTVTIRLNNSAKIPLQLELRAPVGDLAYSPESVTITVPPKSVRFFDFTVDGRNVSDEDQLDDQLLQWTATYDIENRPAMEISGNAAIVFDPKRVVKMATPGTAIDGNFSEWETLWSSPQDFRQIIGSRRAWQGMEDCSLQLATQYDENFIYIAARIQDDSVVPAPADASRSKAFDNVNMFMSVSGVESVRSEDSDTPAEPGLLNNDIHVMAAPTDAITTGLILLPEQQQVSATCQTTTGGYQLEMAVPVEMLDETQGQPWKYFRLNVKINDRDTTGSKWGELWWKTDWNSVHSDPQSGLFVRDVTRTESNTHQPTQ